MAAIRPFPNLVIGSFVAKSEFSGDKRKKTQLAAYLTAYIVGALGAFGLTRLVHAPDWLSALSIVISLVSGAVTSIIQKNLDTLSVPLSRIVAAILAGVATVLLPIIILDLRAQYLDIDARKYITASGNKNIHPGQSALFIIDVPSHRDYLTVRFAGTPSPEDSENCINGANLILVQDYGATASDRSTHGFGDEYTIEIPPGVNRFSLSATFVPQLGFEVCEIDVTVASAKLYN